jgi:hypothetical protein
MGPPPREDPTLVTDLMGAYGEVASAQYAQQMWLVAKVVRDNPVVAAEFDKGVDGLLQRLDGVCRRKPSSGRRSAGSSPNADTRAQRLGDLQPHMGEHCPRWQWRPSTA